MIHQVTEQNIYITRHVFYKPDNLSLNSLNNSHMNQISKIGSRSIKANYSPPKQTLIALKLIKTGWNIIILSSKSYK